MEVDGALIAGLGRRSIWITNLKLRSLCLELVNNQRFDSEMVPSLEDETLSSYYVGFLHRCTVEDLFKNQLRWHEVHHMIPTVTQNIERWRMTMEDDKETYKWVKGNFVSCRLMNSLSSNFLGILYLRTFSCWKVGKHVNQQPVRRYQVWSYKVNQSISPEAIPELPISFVNRTHVDYVLMRS